MIVATSQNTIAAQNQGATSRDFETAHLSDSKKPSKKVATPKCGPFKIGSPARVQSRASAYLFYNKKVQVC